ncbi:unnamed protein product, partial [Vitis vinifera]|uniref:Spt5 KOW domain-containing protein n=1 Tax=Vitis vinifera TaxID=29760 RepID=D7U679_VITVI
MKNGKYKGDLAQIVVVSDAQKKAIVKLIPRIDLQAMAEKFVIYLLHKILSFSSEFILLDVTFSSMKLLYVDLFYYCFDSIYRFFFFLYGIQISETKTNTQLFMIFFEVTNEFKFVSLIKKKSFIAKSCSPNRMLELCYVEIHNMRG